MSIEPPMGAARPASGRKICHIAATTEGATWMFEQLRDLRDRYGYDVHAIVSTGQGGLIEKLKAEQIPFHQFDFSFPGAGQGYTLLTRVFELARLFRRERFDIIQSHLFDSMILARLAGWLADVPVRLTMIAGPYHLEAATPRWIDGATWWMQTLLIPSCDFTRQLYRDMGVPDNRLAVVYYGPDESKFNPNATLPSDIRHEMEWDVDTPLVGMVAYFYPAMSASTWTPPRLVNRANKRHEDLVEAAPLILREFPQTRFLLIGSGWGEAGEQQQEKVRQMVYEAQLEQQFAFLGFRSDVNNILRELDVAVQAALSENLGGTIESLLMECPTVATRVGGMVDSVRDGETGVLVEPLNPTALAQGILSLMRNPQAARALGRNGRQLMLEKFTLRHTVDDLNRIYGSLLQKAPAPYRRWIAAMRVGLAIPLFAFLALRLRWDTSEPNRNLLLQRGQSARHAMRNRARVTTKVVSFWPRFQGLPRHFFLLVSGLVRAFVRWLYLRPLYVYGDIRYLLRGTAVLRRWDVFFARIRGRKPL